MNGALVDNDGNELVTYSPDDQVHGIVTLGQILQSQNVVLKRPRKNCLSDCCRSLSALVAG